MKQFREQSTSDTLRTENFTSDPEPRIAAHPGDRVSRALTVSARSSAGRAQTSGRANERSPTRLSKKLKKSDTINGTGADRGYAAVATWAATA